MELVAAIAKAIGYVFINPIFYLLVVVSIYMGIKRVKKERTEFQTRVFDVVEDLKTAFGFGIILSLVFSVVALFIGISFSFQVLVVLAAVYFVLLLPCRPRLLSPSLVLGFAIMMLMILPHVTTGISLIDNIFSSVQARTYGQLLVLLAMLLIAEAILIMKSGTKKTSPFHLLSKRGRLIGAHESNKLWLFPLIFFVPQNSGMFSPNWWPSLTVAGESYTIIMFPFIIGFYQLVKGKLPEQAIFNSGLRVLLLGVVVLVATAISYYYPLMIPITVGLALVCREGLYLYERYVDQNRPHFFTNRKEGLMVLGVIPQSPAAKMNIRVGEAIHKVNGRKVTNEDDFYAALQINSAFCKLEVLDDAGEIRFANRALFEGDHHELGLIFIDEKFELKLEEVAT
ncbi:hypothetical protein CIB95_12210 [Lottiidibacillus patelloidae]|uniref:PDZ domain-containing protein n=1 Tax=Lottiidibacillus patelloidae TaxID=2670334 RepID=A0A263BSI2_9BACI|nr:PDZ domain-containing protein [Lottiidibacillus patelloidae]OZM56528.1 hypothetical protein CIB95_12210 [Lottiidibacillus patelloidae]